MDQPVVPETFPRVFASANPANFADGSPERAIYEMAFAAQAALNVGLFGRDNQHTEIVPTRNDTDPVTYSFLVLGKTPVITTDLRRHWAVAIIVALGQGLNNSPLIPATEVCISDAPSFAAGKSFALPCSFVKRLQADLAAGRVGPDEAYTHIHCKLRAKAIESKP